jgi:hypothetical protein
MGNKRINKDKECEVGYKRPPRHSQFQPGKSGNPNGRPKKSESIVDVLQKELYSLVPVLKDGKRRRISMLRAIIKQHLNKAAAGDTKSMNILLNALRFYKTDNGDNLGVLVQEFRAIHLRHVASERSGKGVLSENEDNFKPE